MVRRLREDQELTQSGLARLIETNRSFVNNIECGRRMPGYEIAARLARAFDLSLGQLLDEAERESPSAFLALLAGIETLVDRVEEQPER